MVPSKWPSKTLDLVWRKSNLKKYGENNDKIYHWILWWGKKSDSRPVEWLPEKGGTLHYHNLPANTEWPGGESNTLQIANNRGRLTIYSPMEGKLGCLGQYGKNIRECVIRSLPRRHIVTPMWPTSNRGMMEIIPREILGIIMFNNQRNNQRTEKEEVSLLWV